MSNRNLPALVQEQEPAQVQVVLGVLEQVLARAEVRLGPLEQVLARAKVRLDALDRVLGRARLGALERVPGRDLEQASVAGQRVQVQLLEQM